MELAVNTFSKGLQLDTHPMVLGADVLSDCLNGTLLTMNGNEVVLLNDMGNRRVNNAFLPSGYLPVGMKEYGGIIYIAAYNPITNKSLIGSFPSPQRKIDKNNKDLLPAELDLSNLEKCEEDSDLENIYTLTNDSILIPLTLNISLRAGDKFALYSGTIWEYKNLISNFDFTDKNTKKAKSPKNKKYTLQVGILNSLNEFVDITKTLCRWDYYSNMINYDSSYSDTYKFNDGYFISSEFRNDNFLETISDSKLIKARLKIATNTYAYKLVGPMYLKATLNHIKNFDYNIYGIKEEDGTATLWIEGYLIYNCPDSSRILDLEEDGDLNYFSYEEVIPNFNGFDLLINGSKKYPEGGVLYEKSKYNPNTNLYTTKITKKYTNIVANDEENSNIFNFVLGVNAGDLKYDTNDIYLKGLSVKDSLDLSLLGSDKIQITGWKFYNNVNEKYTLLTFTFKAYPAYGKYFSDFLFVFTSLKNSGNVFKYTLPTIYNGRQTVRIDWSDDSSELNTLKEKSVYRVTAFYKILDTETFTENTQYIQLEDITEDGDLGRITETFLAEGTPTGETPSEETPTEETPTITIDVLEISNDSSSDSSSSDSNLDQDTDNSDINRRNILFRNSNNTRNDTVLKNSRWLLTTELFNEFYNKTGISDYCTVSLDDITENMSLELKNTIEDFLSKLEIELKAELYLTDKTKFSQDFTGSLISKTTDIMYKAANKCSLDIEHNENSRFIIPDETLYPVKILSGENGLKLDKVKIEITGKKVDLVKGIIPPTIINDSVSLNNIQLLTGNEVWVDYRKDPIPIQNNSVQTDITLYDIFKGKINEGTNTGSRKIPTAKNVFLPLSEVLENVSPMDKNWGYCGVSVNYDTRGWTKIKADGHIIDVIVSHDNSKHTEEPDDSNLPRNGARLEIVWQTSKKRYNVRDYASEIYSLFNSGTLDSLMFTYLTVGWNSCANRMDKSGSWNPRDNDINSWPPEDEHGSVVNGENTSVRTWWKTLTGWALFYDDKTPDLILKKYVYCIWNQNDGIVTLYATKEPLECKYNDKYNVIIDSSIIYKRDGELKIEKYEIGNLRFNVSILDNISKNITKVLESSQEFLDNINNLNTDSVLNVFVGKKKSAGDNTSEDIITLLNDKDGNTLDPNIIYEFVKEGNDFYLIKSPETNKFLVDLSGSGINHANFMLYNGRTLGRPKFRYNLIGSDNENKTYADFDGMEIVSSNLL